MVDMANILGKELDAKKYSSVRTTLRKVFHERFFDNKTMVYGHDELELQSLVAAPLALDESVNFIPAGQRFVFYHNLYCLQFE